MDLDEAVLRDWEDDDAFSMLNENDLDFAVASSMQSKYNDELNLKDSEMQASAKDVELFSVLSDDELDFVIASSLQSEYDGETNTKALNNQVLPKDETFLKGLDEDLDYAFALSLQTEYEEDGNSNIKLQETAVKASKDSKPLSIVDKEWELIDPNPDVHALFLEFNAKYFYGKLLGVEVRWSPRMYSCAGICCYEGRGGLCSVRLSLPLLKLRPRRDLVETLLHEMIHAYLFVTHNNKDREGHGPEFLSHMNRINRETGTRISVYHSFHDEVDVYRTHWWKCDGPCKHRRPFYGLVKRTMNRAPGPSDNWWSAHQASCGGNFIKIREPENFKKKSSKRKTASDSNSRESNSDIRNFMKLPKVSSGKKNPSKPYMTKSSNISTITSVISKEDNVVPIKANEVISKKDFIPFRGSGFKLGGESKNNVVPPYLSKYSNEASSSTKQKNWPSSSSEKSLGSVPSSNSSGKSLVSVPSSRVLGKSLGSVPPSRSSGKSLGSVPPSRSSGKFLGSMLPSQFPKIPSSSKISNLKNKDSKSSSLQGPDSPSKKLVQSPIKKFFSPEGATVMKDQLQNKIVNAYVPKVKESNNYDFDISKVSCPICFVKVKDSEINSHLDECLHKS